MGLGFTVGLTSIGIVRELIGSGKIFNIQILPGFYMKPIYNLYSCTRSIFRTCLSCCTSEQSKE